MHIGARVISPRLLAVASLLAALLGSVVAFWLQLDEVQRQTEQAFELRASLMRHYVSLMREKVASMQTLVEDQYLHYGSRGEAAELSSLRYDDKNKVWVLDGKAGRSLPLSGTITGNWSTLDKPLRRELSAALVLDSSFRSMLNNRENIAWIYYTSARHFIFLAPAVTPGDFHFDESIYRKEFWSQAEPKANPQMRQIISDLYEDSAGKGLMITISSPVLVEGRFLGVVSVDLGVQLLKELVGNASIAGGESLLVDEHGKIVVRSGEFSPGERYRIAADEMGWNAGRDGYVWLSQLVVPGELTLLFRIERHKLYWQVMQKSSFFWLLIWAVLTLFALTVQLRQVLLVTTSQMRSDALTGALNRRGFFGLATAQLNAGWDEGERAAIIMFDIDHFKLVNDRHGHDVGDQVLTELVMRLKGHVRHRDLVCRWGGEEFVVLMVHDVAVQPLELAERLRRQVQRQPFTTRQLPLTLSAGVVSLRGGETLEAAISRADRWLYRAKNEGRNCTRPALGDELLPEEEGNA